MGIMKKMTEADAQAALAKVKAQAEAYRKVFLESPKPAPKVTMTYEEAKARVAELRKKNESKTL
jgi:hypothetical protein